MLKTFFTMKRFNIQVLKSRVGSTDASDSRDPHEVGTHPQALILYLKDENKEKEAGVPP